MDRYRIAAGDRVALKSGNSGGFVLTLFALMHTGASIVMLDQHQRAEESGRIARRTKVRLAVVDEEAAPVPGTRSVSVYELLAEAADRPPADGRIRIDAWSALTDALITWSSGSTGEPKGVVKPGHAMIRNLERTIARMEYGPRDVLLPLLPFSHQYGLSLVLIAWLAGSALVVAPYRRLDRAIWMAGRTGATVVDTTPAVYQSMLNLVERRPELAGDLSGVRMYCTGGAPLDQAAADRFTRAFGLPLLDGYGSTELGNVSFATPADPVGCGRVLDGVEVLVTEDGATPLPPGEVGELLVRSPDAFQGYLDARGEIVPATWEWYRSGDLGALDEDGHLFVMGRKAAVHRAGYTLYPDVIERKAAGCGAPVKVVPVPDDRLGSRLVFLVEDPENRDPRHWRERICALLPLFEQPNRVLVVDGFPLNDNGKPDRRQLLRLASLTTAETAGEADLLIDVSST